MGISKAFVNSILNVLTTSNYLCKNEMRDIELILFASNVEVLDDILQARGIMILDSLIELRLTDTQVEILETHGMCDARNAWKDYFKHLHRRITVDQKFHDEETEYLVSQVRTKYRQPFVNWDKSKHYGINCNKTFWAELTYYFNLRFPERKRGVVAIRNKFKGLVAAPPRRFADILSDLRNERLQARRTLNGLKSTKVCLREKRKLSNYFPETSSTRKQPKLEQSAASTPPPPILAPYYPSDDSLFDDLFQNLEPIEFLPHEHFHPAPTATSSTSTSHYDDWDQALLLTQDLDLENLF